MFTLFLKERSAWISFFVVVFLSLNIIFYLDSGFSGVSISYFNIVILLFFILFFIWRYVKETQQLKNFLGNVAEGADLLSFENISLSPFQRKYIETVMHIITQKELLLNESRVKLQEDTEELLAWVHEMKTPLTALKLMIDQMEDAKNRTKLEKEWIRLHLLLDQQLHSTRLGMIEKDNRIEKVTLRTVVYQEIRGFQTWCIEKGIGFDVEELSQEISTDKKWLGFIVRQILSNAIKYSYDNEEIKIFTEIDSRGHLLLHFHDHGVGIRQEDLPRIFHKSYTGTTGRASSHSTGMGLYLAQNAATKLGIEISVESKVNEGSRFTIRFPLQNEYQDILGR